MKKKRGSHAHPLVKYIDEQLNRGYSEEIIKNHLKNYGHDIDLIQRSIKTAKKTRFHILSKIMILLCIFIALFLIFWISLSASAGAGNVFIGFLPTILCLIISIILIEKPKNRSLRFLWTLPFILVILFLVIGPAISIFENLDIGKLAVINFIISFVFILILYLTGSLRQDTLEIIPEKKLKSKKKVFKKISGEKELKKYLQSIEDKCKAINFAIGRVYSNKRGGSDTLRNKIKINKVWYNEISKALKDGYNKKKDKNKILINIKKIKERLELLDKTEKQVFGNSHAHLKNINRRESGDNKILHVLIKNDKDPINTYFDGATEFCEKIRKSL